MKTLRNTFYTALFLSAFAFFITGCQPGSVVSPDQNSSSGSNTALNLKNTGTWNSYIEVQDVKILFKDVNFTNEQNSITKVLIGQISAVLTPHGSQSHFYANNITPGYYQAINFTVDKPVSSAAVSDPEFFQNGTPMFSIIVHATYLGQDITYRSRIVMSQDVTFPNPLYVSNTGTANVFFNVAPVGWFFRDGQYLDPNDPNNAGMIDENIRNSFSVTTQ